MTVDELGNSDRREFLRRMAMAGAFVVPAVASYSMMVSAKSTPGGVSASNASAGPSTGAAAPPTGSNASDPSASNVSDPSASNVTTTTVAPTTTTVAPTTTTIAPEEEVVDEAVTTALPSTK